MDVKIKYAEAVRVSLASKNPGYHLNRHSRPKIDYSLLRKSK